jgi:hypothetical protein
VRSRDNTGAVSPVPFMVPGGTGVVQHVPSSGT